MSPVPPSAAAPGPDGDDWDADADMARLLDDIDSGREQIPPEDEQPPAVMFTLGEAADVDPAGLAVMAGPYGLGGQLFAQLRPAAVMRPGPLLAALAENAADDLDALTGDELLGVVSAARRLQNRAEYLELAAVAEFTRRAQAAYAASVAAKARPGRRDGEFAADDLAMELVISGHAASDRMDLALALATRLRKTFAGLAGGVIDGDKAHAIWYYTRFLTDADAASADAELAQAAPGLRYDSLARKAAKLEMKLDPAGVRARKEHARAQGRRVQARLEASGNMSFGGRELSAAEALAAKASNDADAAAMRRAGIAGTLRELRVQALLDRITGRDPLHRAAPDGLGADNEDQGQVPGSPAARPAPVPALINLTIPAGTLLGWSTTPGDAGTWGLLDPGDTRDIVTAARALNITLSPITAGTCDHRHREDRYTPSRKLGHLVRARTATCTAPGCGAQARYCDLDHTLAYPERPTCECNLGPPCRRHHRIKQAPGWTLEQPQPGVMRWTTPSGRVHTTTPTVYDL
jgi:hypothetical protein